MLICIDVGYREDHAVAAAVTFHHWHDTQAAAELVERISPIEPYVPGQFYRRELPCILAVLRAATVAPSCVVIDGYVWLGGTGRPGLGAYLHQALDEVTPIIGVSKNPFKQASPVAEVFRGDSQRPLYVSAAGLALPTAAEHIRGMHGDHRMPTLLRRVDQLSRGIHQGLQTGTS